MEINENDRQRVLEKLAPLVAMFPHYKPENADLTFEVYVRMLVDLDPLMLEAGILHLLSQPLEFMPSAGVIRQTGFDLRARAAGVLTPYEAWAEVRAYIDAGAGHPISGRGLNGHPDPAIQKAVKSVGGWRVLSLSENLVADRARFVDSYRELCRRDTEMATTHPEVQAIMGKLAGQLSAPTPVDMSRNLAHKLSQPVEVSGD